MGLHVLVSIAVAREGNGEVTPQEKMLARAREYKGVETENFVPENKLTPEREAELRAHLMQCEMPYFSCDDCWELYQNIGYQEYVKLIVVAGPTESERLL